MEDLKTELKNLLKNTMIPEADTHLQELHQDLKNNPISQELSDALEDMKSFKEELEFILKNVENNTITEEEALIVYEKIVALLNDHEGEE